LPLAKHTRNLISKSRGGRFLREVQRLDSKFLSLVSSLLYGGCVVCSTPSSQDCYIHMIVIIPFILFRPFGLISRDAHLERVRSLTKVLLEPFNRAGRKRCLPPALLILRPLRRRCRCDAHVPRRQPDKPPRHAGG